MNENAKVAISADFLSAFAALPRQIQGKVTEFINKFRNNPFSNGINFEKLQGGADKKSILFVSMKPIEVLSSNQKIQMYFYSYGLIIMMRLTIGLGESVVKLIH